MHGGMKTYRGSAAGARNYVEAGRARADDYYLAEGAGVAEHYAASPDVGVRRRAPLSGDQYEAWVAGLDPATIKAARTAITHVLARLEHLIAEHESALDQRSGSGT